MKNRLFNIGNPYQGNALRVLCVCSAGLLRSPTAALVLANEYGFNTRSAGIDAGHALIVADEVLLAWADAIVCMESKHTSLVQYVMSELGIKEKPVYTLGIRDDFEYMQQSLVDCIKATSKSCGLDRISKTR